MPPPIAAPRWVVVLYRAAAVSNFVVTVPAFVAYDAYLALLKLPVAPNYPFLIWIWAGMAFLWGVMFWEIAGAPTDRLAMFKYTYLEKLVTSTSVAVGVATHNVPMQAALGIVFTDVIWIPLFMLAHRAMRAPAPAAPR